MAENSQPKQQPKKVKLVTFDNGGRNVRRVISKADWKKMGVELDTQVWERSNNWTVDASSWSPLALKYFERDKKFKVEEHDG